MHVKRLDGASDRSIDSALHLHGFHDEQAVALLHLLVERDSHSRDYPGYWRADLTRLVRVCLRFRLLRDLQGTIANRDFAGLTIEFEEDRAGSIGMRFTDCQKLDGERLAGLDFHGDVSAFFHPVVKLGCGECLDLAPVMSCPGKLYEHVGVHEIA